MKEAESLPTVSIVMPSLNQGLYIEEAINSVLSQSWERLELIVQDGGSEDETLTILRRISEQDPRLKYSVDMDTGPAEALNKALANAKGTIIGWLNTDDLFVPGAIERAVDHFSMHQNAVFIYGHGVNIDEAGKKLGNYPTLPAPWADNEVIPAAIQFVQGCFISQPTVFFKRVVYTLLGKLDESLQASFDMDYWIRVFRAFDGRIDFLPVEQAKTRIYDGTITSTQRSAVAVEGTYLSLKHFNVETVHWLRTFVDERQQSSTAGYATEQELQFLERQLASMMALEQATKLIGYLRAERKGHINET